MKKPPSRNRNRSASRAAKTAEAEATEIDPRANGDAQLSAALKSYEALAVGDRLHFLAIVLRDEIGRKAGGPVPAVDARDPPAPGLPPPPESKTDLAATPDAVPEHSLAEPPPTENSPAVQDPPVSWDPPATLDPHATPDMSSTAGLAKLQIVESAEFARSAETHFPLPVKMSDVRDRRTAVRAARFPMVSLVMTMVCSFVLTLGVMLWRRQSDAAASQPLAAASQPFAAAMPPATPPSWPAARPVVAPVPAPAPPRRLAAANPAQDDHDAANELPIELSFRRRPVGNEGESAGRSGWELTGRIHNLSNDPLAVDVSVDGEQGSVSAQVFIEPDSDAEFGAKEGLVIHPNDRITLHSAPYSDIVSQVR